MAHSPGWNKFFKSDSIFQGQSLGSVDGGLWTVDRYIFQFITGYKKIFVMLM